MGVSLTRINETDLQHHVSELIGLGNDPRSDGFWVCIRRMILTFSEMADRPRLVYWMMAQKRSFQGNKGGTA